MTRRAWPESCLRAAPLAMFAALWLAALAGAGCQMSAGRFLERLPRVAADEAPRQWEPEVKSTAAEPPRP